MKKTLLFLGLTPDFWQYIEQKHPEFACAPFDTIEKAVESLKGDEDAFLGVDLIIIKGGPKPIETLHKFEAELPASKNVKKIIVTDDTKIPMERMKLLIKGMLSSSEVHPTDEFIQC